LENWKDPETSAWVRTFTILTTEANELVATLHDRMPVILAPEDRDRWLTDLDPADLMRPYPADLMTMWPVSPEVNSVKNDRPELLERVPDEQGPASGEVERVNEAEPPCEPATRSRLTASESQQSLRAPGALGVLASVCDGPSDLVP
jgi:hypothetical protein